MKRSRYNSSPAIGGGVPNSRYPAAAAQLGTGNHGPSNTGGTDYYGCAIMDRYDDYYRDLIDEKVSLRYLATFIYMYYIADSCLVLNIFCF